MAPTISSELFCRMRRTIEAPMGPTPYWTTRIFFFNGDIPSDFRSHNLKVLASGLQPILRRL